MRTILTLAAGGALALSACATVPAEGEDRPAGDTCRKEPGQSFIGQRASPESGAAIMRATHSTRLRWVPPNTAVTMEYAFGRVTVSYDDSYRITTVSCS
jgi:hypothetical protein